TKRASSLARRGGGSTSAGRRCADTPGLAGGNKLVIGDSLAAEQREDGVAEDVCVAAVRGTPVALVEVRGEGLHARGLVAAGEPAALRERGVRAERLFGATQRDADPVGREPGGLVAAVEHLLQLVRRHAVRRLDEQVHAEEPLRERQVRVVEERL